MERSLQCVENRRKSALPSAKLFISEMFMVCGGPLVTPMRCFRCNNSSDEALKSVFFPKEIFRKVFAFIQYAHFFELWPLLFKVGGGAEIGGPSFLR